MERNDKTSEATKLYADDAPSGDRLDESEPLRSYYQRLANANSPEWDGPRRDENVTTERDHKNLLDAVATSLSLTDYQRQRAEKIVENLPSRHFRANKNVAVILSVCGHVGREDGRSYHPTYLSYEPHELDDASAESFCRFAKDSNITYRDIIGCWNRIGGEL